MFLIHIHHNNIDHCKCTVYHCPQYSQEYVRQDIFSRHTHFQISLVSHGVLVHVHWSSVLNPRTLVEQKWFVVSKLGFCHFIFYLPFSVIITDITLATCSIMRLKVASVNNEVFSLRAGLLFIHVMAIYYLLPRTPIR
jgi:hypothetical protein